MGISERADRSPLMRLRTQRFMTWRYGSDGKKLGIGAICTEANACSIQEVARDSANYLC
jgi:hypothetical protein